MSDKIEKIGGITKLDLPTDRILEAAVGRLDSVILIGWTKDSKEYFCSSMASTGENLELLERFKRMLLEY